MSATTDRFDRLPRWAQHEIGRLRREVEHLEAQRSAGPEDSNTFRWDGYDSKEGPKLTPLGSSPTIRFGDRFDVVLRDDGQLEVRGVQFGNERLVIRPYVSNEVHVGTER